jgi:orotate phosphoribosyltransferase-like protein
MDMHDTERIALRRLLRFSAPNKPRFEPLAIQTQPQFLTNLTEALSNQIHSSVDSVCALATSGVPLGVFLSQELGLPLFFHHSTGWPRLDTGEVRVILPELSGDRSMLLTDSHIIDGHTALRAILHINQNTPARAVSLAVIIDQDLFPTLDLPVHKIRASRMSALAEVLQHELDLETRQEAVEMLQPGAKLWEKASRGLDVGYPGKPSQFLRAVWPPRTGRIDTIPLNVPDALRQRLRRIPVTDREIWSFFEHPDLVRETCAQIGRSLDLSRYEVLVGTSVLGSALALALVYHLGASVPVYSAYMEKQLSPPPAGSLGDASVLLCQLRLASGLHTVSALRQIRRAGTEQVDVLAVFADTRAVAGWRKLPLRQLPHLAARIFVLMKPPTGGLTRV